MEFRLLYEGTILGASRTSTRAVEKHEIRKALHPQLRWLWATHPRLLEYAEHIGNIAHASQQYKLGVNPTEITEQEAISKAYCSMGSNWSTGGFQCVPLATEKLALRCSLDILLLRPDEKRFIFEQGDIDGQVKTIFDALRIPKNKEEAGGASPSEDETPFFCLLEDDRLISEVRVTTDRLLLLPGTREVKANDAFAVITVRINHKHPGTFDQWFS